MKKLIICDTHYQFITAIQMRLTIFNNDIVDIWISDHSLGAKKIAENTDKLKIFNSVQFINTKKKSYSQNSVNNIFDIIKNNFGHIILKEIPLYDEVVFYGLDLLIISIADFYNSKNHETTWSRFEEGIFSYDTDFSYGKRVQLSNKIRRITGRPIVDNLIKNYYCFYPELKELHLEWNLIQIPSIYTTREVLCKLLKSIYQCTEMNILQKYIFFASSSDIDGTPYGETDLVLKIADKIGYENILIKMHPRDSRNVYEKSGISVMKESSIPWEVIYLVSDFSDKIMLTVNSGAFISISALDNASLKGIFLFNIVETNDHVFKERAKNIENMVHKLQKIGLCGCIEIAQSKEKMS